jgi:hypothetical protein
MLGKLKTNQGHLSFCVVLSPCHVSYHFLLVSTIACEQRVPFRPLSYEVPRLVLRQ